MSTIIDFNNLPAGTVVDNEFSTDGVTISASGGSNLAMIFDTEHPTGGDNDLASTNLGNVLIVSEDGDSSDPDDEAGRSTLTFTFDEPSTVNRLTFLDVEHGAWVKFYDAHGNHITTFDAPRTADNGQVIVDFDVEGVVRMEVLLGGSGAIDNLVFEPSNPAGDGVVDGDNDADLIDVAYVGDPEGDRIDAGDALLSGQGPDDDIVDARDGDDTVISGEGNDWVYAGSGDDSVEGGDGNDFIVGDTNADVTTSGETAREVFEWDVAAQHPGLQQGVVTQNTGSVEVTFTNLSVPGASGTTDFASNEQNVANIDGDGAPVNGHSSLSNILRTEGTSAEFQLDFSKSVEDVSFRINDLDGDGTVTVTALDADGNQIPVNLEGGRELILSDNDGVNGNETAVANGPYRPDTSAENALLVSVAGPVAQIVITHENTGPNDTGINITDVYFDVPGTIDFTLNHVGIVTDGGDAGNDILDGGAGDDTIIGEDGSDTIIGGTGNNLLSGGAGDDVFIGGEGADSFDGGAGQDIIDYSASDAAVNVDLANHELSGGDADNDTITNGIDGIIGSDGDDVLRGFDAFSNNPADSFTNVLTGGAGNDTIDGRGGPDILSGGDDRDVILGTAGDVVDGGAGGDDFDILDLTGQGLFILQDVVEDGNNNGINGTVVFVDTNGNPTGETLVFTEIERILGDEFNQAPDAVDDLFTLDEDTSVVFDPLSNDSDPDGDPLSIVGDLTASNGTVTDNGDGTFTYTPDANFFGPDTVTYTVADPDGLTDTATITFKVLPVNDAPDAMMDLASTPEDTPVLINVLANDTDVDGDTLTITGVSVPAEQGTVEIVGNQVRYTPAENFNGQATITYSIEDGNGGTDTAAAVVNVTPVNDDPVAVDDVANTLEDEPVVINLINNDFDVDGDPLTITSVSVPADEGTVVDNGDGTVTFTPALNFTGTATITYSISDGQGGSDEGMAVVVTVDPVNDGPVAEYDTAETHEDTPVTIDVLANDSDPEGDPLTVTSATVPSDEGTVEIVGNALVFTPAPDFNGEATITYTIDDGSGGADLAEVVVTVNPVNDGPEAVDDILNTDEDTPITFAPAENDADDETPISALRVVDVSVDPEFGTVELDPATNEVTFTPAPDFTGPVEITYVVEDQEGAQDTGTALVNVGPVNDAPEAADDTATMDQGTAVMIDVLANDEDPDGDPITVISATVPANQGEVTYNGDGTLTFTPAPDYVGEAEITYTIADPDGLTSTATVTVTVDDVIGPVDGTDDGQLMTPGFADVEGDEVDGSDGLNDTIFGNGGDDTIDGGAGNDTIDGGDDNDSITGGTGDDSVQGGDGSDTLAGGEGDDTLLGGAGDDDILVGGDDQASGGTGDDVFSIDATDPDEDVSVVIDGGSDGTDGNPDGPENGDEGDVLDLSDQSDDLLVEFTADDPEAGDVDGLDTVDSGAPDLEFTEIERVITGSGDDVVDGNASDGPIDVVTNDGDDTITGTNGDDVIDSGDDDDMVTTGGGADTVDGGDGNNVIDTSSPDDLVDDKNGDGFGFGSFGPLPPVIADGDEDNDRDLVTTGSGNDDITTGDDDDTIMSGEGDDTINSGIDDDSVDAGDGDDLITTGEGSDTVLGGDGNDTIFGGLGPSVPDTINLTNDGSGNPFGGTPDPDTENGRDLIDGGDGDDLIFGEDDNDTITGGTGNDTIDGGVDDDVIEGGIGDDVILGGQGADDLSGGDGEDTFIVDEAGDGVGDIVDGGSGGAVVSENDPNTPGEDWDVLDLRGSAPAGGRLEVTETGPDANGNGVDGFVTFFDEDGNTVGTLNFTEIEEIIPCFTPGTMIATPTGERRVEALKVGDRVITRDNGIQQIRWIGSRDMTGDELNKAEHLRPVLIRQGALGKGLPERDMLVSPQHRVLIANDKTTLYFDESEVLVAAKHLTFMDGISVVDASHTTYIHVMFDQHEVILSDGIWTESFQPGDQTLGAMGDAQYAEILELFPELETAEGIEAYSSARRSLKKHEAQLLKQ